MHIAVCDDDKIFIDEIITYIPKNKDYVIDTFSLSKDLYDRGDKYDLAFLDIRMNNYDGLTLADRLCELNPKCVIVLFTAFTQYAIDGYKHHTFDYILKSDNKLVKKLAVEKALIEADERMNLGASGANLLRLNTKGGEVKFNPLYIVYIEAANNDIKVYTDRDTYICRCTMYDIESKLDNKLFKRCHRSYIVNTKYVKSIKRGNIILTNNYEVPIGRKYKKEILL